ncbi:MAG: hypothetical protein ACLU6B_11075 [Lachnospirales bacterium]
MYRAGTKKNFLKFHLKGVRGTENLVAALVEGEQARREMAYRAADPGDAPACPGKEGKTMHGKKALIRDDNIRIPPPRQCGPEERGALPDLISQSVIDRPGNAQRGILQDSLVQQYLTGTEGQIGILGVVIRM